jgi:hypothetical protein
MVTGVKCIPLRYYIKKGRLQSGGEPDRKEGGAEEPRGTGGTLRSGELSGAFLRGGKHGAPCRAERWGANTILSGPEKVRPEERVR